jgi:hypothetical protein
MSPVESREEMLDEVRTLRRQIERKRSEIAAFRQSAADVPFCQRLEAGVWRFILGLLWTIGALSAFVLVAMTVEFCG